MNLHVTVDGPRPYNHITILVDTPPTKGEPGAAYQLCMIRVARATKGMSTDLGTKP